MNSDELLLALDVDGTILHHDGRLSEAVAEQIRELDALDQVTVVIATGRSVLSTMPVLEQLGLNTPGRPAVCSNGAVTIRVDPDSDAGYILDDVVTFDPAPAVTLVKASLPDALIAVEEVGVGYKVSTPFPTGELWGEERIVAPEDLTAAPAVRVTFRDPESSPEEFERLIEKVGLHGVSYAIGYSAWLDLAPEGVSKASALEQVRRHVQVEPHRTVAVGDQRNDIEMLHWAARGVAMGQAPEEVMAIADEVTGSVEDDGLAEALRRVREDFIH